MFSTKSLKKERVESANKETKGVGRINEFFEASVFLKGQMQKKSTKD